MLLVLVLNKTYYHVPGRELKRRARAGDKLAKQLYRTAAYGVEVRLLLGAAGVIFAAISFVEFALALKGWEAFLVIAFLLWLGYIWIPSTKLTGIASQIGYWCSTPIAALLRYLHPILKWINKLMESHYPFHSHTEMYEADDLVNLIEWQKSQPDNRIASDQLDIAINSLTFGNKLVRNIFTPLREVTLVSAKDSISPILIDELHKTGHSRFPVYNGKKDDIVGTLYLTDVINLKQQGKISEVMHKGTFFVHEDFNLHQVLEAFFKTRRQLFMVINKFEEITGIITIEDILSQIVGKQIPDEFGDYDNPRAVAELLAKREHEHREKARQEPEEKPESEQPPEDVIE